MNELFSLFRKNTNFVKPKIDRRKYIYVDKYLVQVVQQTVMWIKGFHDWERNEKKNKNSLTIYGVVDFALNASLQTGVYYATDSFRCLNWLMSVLIPIIAHWRKWSKYFAQHATTGFSPHWSLQYDEVCTPFYSMQSLKILNFITSMSNVPTLLPLQPFVNIFQRHIVYPHVPVPLRVINSRSVRL